MFKSLRRLKVSYHSPDSRSTAPVRPRLEPIPFLRLQGRWLAEAGFDIGSDVRVEVSKGRLVLEVIEPEPLLHVADSGRRTSRRLQHLTGDPVGVQEDGYAWKA